MGVMEEVNVMTKQVEKLNDNIDELKCDIAIVHLYKIIKLMAMLNLAIIVVLLCLTLHLMSVKNILSQVYTNQVITSGEIKS